jgi:DNA helicase TIP49 (TBP-interacting protein)
MQYEIPSEDELKQIWKILATQYKIQLSDKQIVELVQTFNKISGRAVRNMLKLSKLLAARNKKPVDVELIKYISQFQDIERKEIIKD